LADAALHAFGEQLGAHAYVARADMQAARQLLLGENPDDRRVAHEFLGFEVVQRLR
jgi:hypothetical protein